MSESIDVGPEIAGLGDKIAALTLKEAVQLKDYLKTKYNIEPAAGGGSVGPGGDIGCFEHSQFIQLP